MENCMVNRGTSCVPTTFEVITNQTGRIIRRAFDGMLEALGLVWSEFFEQSIRDYYGTFTTIEIDGIQYRINRNMTFYQLVRSGGKMDLKAQPEWQHSAYIYDGELVSQDALGNINYGYFGAFCNIPKLVLIFAGGFAQWRSSRNAELDFWYTFFDDPRATYRVLQGIKIYNLWH